MVSKHSEGKTLRLTVQEIIYESSTGIKHYRSTCAFYLHIHYVFVYLFKVMSTEPCALISSNVLLFTIDVNRCRWKCPPVFVYLCKTLCWHVLLFEY